MVATCNPCGLEEEGGGVGGAARGSRLRLHQELHQEGDAGLCTDLQKRANRANQLVLFFLAGANFWEKHAKNRRKTGENTRKQAKTRKKQALFWC